MVLWTIILIVKVVYSYYNHVEIEEAYFFISGFILVVWWCLENDYHKNVKDKPSTKEENLGDVRLMRFYKGFTLLYSKEVESITLDDILLIVSLSQDLTGSKVETCYQMFGWVDKFLQVKNVELSSPEATLLLIKVLGYYHRNWCEDLATQDKLLLGSHVLAEVISNQVQESKSISEGGFLLHLVLMELQLVGDKEENIQEGTTKEDKDTHSYSCETETTYTSDNLQENTTLSDWGVYEEFMCNIPQQSLPEDTLSSSDFNINIEYVPETFCICGGKSALEEGFDFTGCVDSGGYTLKGWGGDVIAEKCRVHGVWLKV